MIELATLGVRAAAVGGLRVDSPVVCTVGHGILGARLAERLCAQIRAWDRDRTAQPAVAAYPARTPEQDLVDGVVIDNQFVRLVVSG